MKCWAPNGYDVVEWPQGKGLTPTEIHDVSEEARERILEGSRKGLAKVRRNRDAKKAQKTQEALEEVSE